MVFFFVLGRFIDDMIVFGCPKTRLEQRGDEWGTNVTIWEGFGLTYYCHVLPSHRRPKLTLNPRVKVMAP